MPKYLRLLLGIPLALTLVMAAINVIVDPFDIYRVATIPRVNELKPQRIADGARVAIGFDLLRGGYPVLFLGTSRVQVTIPREIDGLPAPIENAAMPSADAVEIARAVSLAQQHQGLRCVFIGLDYEIADSSAKTKGTYWLSPLSGASAAMSRVRTALSVTTFNRALQTFAANASGQPLENPTRQFGVAGQRTRFVAITRDYYAKSRSFLYDERRIRLIGLTVERLAKAGIQVVGFISPLHAWNEEAFIRAGNDDNMRRFRRELTQIFEAAAQRKPSAPCIAGPAAMLWDFGGYQPLSQSAIPSETASELQPYYRETSHYRDIVGIAMVRRMLDLSYTLPIAANDFGARLTAASLDTDLAAIDARRVQWVAQNADATTLNALIDEWRIKDADKQSATEKYSLTDADLAEFQSP